MPHISQLKGPSAPVTGGSVPLTGPLVPLMGDLLPLRASFHSIYRFRAWGLKLSDFRVSLRI